MDVDQNLENGSGDEEQQDMERVMIVAESASSSAPTETDQDPGIASDEVESQVRDQFQGQLSVFEPIFLHKLVLIPRSASPRFSTPRKVATILDHLNSNDNDRLEGALASLTTLIKGA